MFVSTSSVMRIISLLLIICIFASAYAASACPNGCSSRGICVNGVCTCAEGLTGADCSGKAAAIPSPYQCPQCYTITVGPAQYYSGPSWALPDGPIVGLNFQGNLSTWQGNQWAERVALGPDPENWEPTPDRTMYHGNNFDTCGAWPMRMVTDGNLVKAFYHAERFCNYGFNGQTRKSAGLAISYDGGTNITMPNYPNNKLIDTATAQLVGQPSGEGDFGLAVKDGYYYMFFSNVEDNTIGVARSTVASGGGPGTWFKYYNGTWTQPGIGGLSAGLANIAGTQTYLHTPSDAFIAVGGRDQYYQTGTGLTASDDGINWAYVGDPLITPDFSLDIDTVLYQSLLGKTYGYDVGSEFDLYYMFVQPGDSWEKRYQIRRSVTMTYIGTPNPASTYPNTQLALTAYVDRTSGQQAESIEAMKYPLMTTKIIGYIMTRPYYHSFPLYECYNYAMSDYFVGSVDECGVAGVQMLRVAGYMWSARVQRDSIAVYRCTATNDMFLSTDSGCDGRAPSQSSPYGFVMQGPELDPLIASKDILMGIGSTWTYTNATPAAQGTVNWYQDSYSTSSWYVGTGAFGMGYDKTIYSIPFGTTSYYFKSSFNTDSTRTLSQVVISVASDDYATVYINGQWVDADSVTWHEAAYWNRQIFVPLSVLKQGENTIAVKVQNGDTWAFFDLQISARYVEAAVAPTTLLSAACALDCGLFGQCGVSGTCQCDNGWSGPMCSIPLCTLTGISNITMVSNGSTWRHNATWSYVRYTPGNWFGDLYDDGFWQLSQAPFGSQWAPYPFNTLISWPRRLLRKTVTLTIPAGQTVLGGMISVASCATHHVWLNGVFIGDALLPVVSHNAQYWNNVYNVSASIFNVNAPNTVAVELLPGDYSFFDLMVQVVVAKESCAIPVVTTSNSGNGATASTGFGGVPSSTPSTTGSITTPSTTRAATNATPTPTIHPTNTTTKPTSKPSNTTNVDALKKGGASSLSVSYTALSLVLCGILVATL